MTTTDKAAGTPKTRTPLVRPAATKPMVAATPPKTAVKPASAKTTNSAASATSAKATRTNNPKPAVAAKPTKIKKIKMVRDSLSMPKTEYAVLDALKLRAAKLGRPIKKTEIIRAGIKVVAALQDAAFLTALQAVPSLKTGRPANAKAN